MRNTAFLLAGMLLLLVQANLHRVTSHIYPGILPSLVLPLILFMGVHEYSIARGAGVAFVLGYATDVVGIAPIGLFAFTFVATFVLARALGVRLAAQTVALQSLLTLAFALVHAVMVLVLLAIFGRDAYVPRALLPNVFVPALATAALAPLVFRLASRIHGATQVKIDREGSRS